MVALCVGVHRMPWKYWEVWPEDDNNNKTVTFLNPPIVAISPKESIRQPARQTDTERQIETEPPRPLLKYIINFYYQCCCCSSGEATARHDTSPLMLIPLEYEIISLTNPSVVSQSGVVSL